MVFTVAVRDGAAPGWSRRAVLGAMALAGAAATVSGCTWGDSPPPEPPPPDPLEPLLESTRELAEWYDGVLAAHPDLADALAPLRDAHHAHESALVEMIRGPRVATPSPGMTPAPRGPDLLVPAEPDEAVAELRRREEEGRTDAARACLAAPAERAALLGAVCAARATHL
jgi:hypothetical protein